MPHVLAAEGGYQEFVLNGGEWAILAFSGLAALLAIGVGFVLMKDVLAEDQGTPKMIEIATAIQEGALGLPQAPVPHDRRGRSSRWPSSCSSPRPRS